MGKESQPDPRTTRVPDLKPGTYRDGSPLDDIQYLECKLILKPDAFTSPKGFRKYGKLVARAAEDRGVSYDTAGAKALGHRSARVMFLDTGNFRLYNNAFILRRRVSYEDGFPVDDPEIVFQVPPP